MANAENSVSEPPNLKFFWGRIPPDPPTRVVPSALKIMPPVTKNLASYGPIITKTAKRARSRNTRSRCFLAGK